MTATTGETKEAARTIAGPGSPCENPGMCPPLVSVVIPVYNEERTIIPCIERVLGSPVCKEVLVVDDGSTDDTRRILHERIEPLGVRVFYQEHNRGKGKSDRSHVVL